jgi:hypothetical protein
MLRETMVEPLIIYRSLAPVFQHRLELLLLLYLASLVQDVLRPLVFFQ